MSERLTKIHNTIGDIRSDKANDEASKISNIKKALKDRQGLLLRRDPDNRVAGNVCRPGAQTRISP
jgi:hypothetical protein